MNKKLLFSTLLLLCISIKALSQATEVNVSGNTNTLTITNNVVTVVDNALVVTANGNITDFTISITGSYVSGDLLAYTGSLPSGITPVAFNATTRSLQFTGTATAADWQTLLRTVTIQTVSATCYQEQRQVSFVVGSKYYNNLNGHFYELSPTSTYWKAGFTNAAAQSYFGRLGYMATLTSQAENSFVSKILGTDSWIGASDDYTYINTAIGVPNTFTNQTVGAAGSSEGKWYWVSGPEKGTKFVNSNAASTSVTGASVSGQYHNFNNGEPNNSGSEHYGEIYVLNGKWNDLKEANNFKTIVEYGGTSTDNETNKVFFTRNLLISGAPSGTITGGNITVCSGTSTVLTHTGLTSPGSIVKWETSFDDFLTAATPITSISSTYTVTPTQDTYYRAVVNNSGCTNLTTSSTRIYVNASRPGNIVASNSSICVNGYVNYNLNGNTGTVTNWQVANNTGFTSATDIANTTTSLLYQLTTSGTYYFRAVISNCGTTIYSNTGTIICSAGTPPVGGTIANADFCGGTTNAGILTLLNSTGTIDKWQKSVDGGIQWADISSSAASTYSFSAIASTTKYRAQVSNTGCGTTLSSVGTVNVYQASVGGTISGGASVCSGTNSTLLTLRDYTGTIQWQSSTTSSSTGFTDIGGATAATYTALNKTATTYYRAVLTNGSCAAANSDVATVTVNPLPAITGTLTTCIGATTQLTGSATAAGATPWVSSAPGVATVSATGLVTGITTGTTTITYTNSNNCAITATITVGNTNAATLTSAAGTVNQTNYINTPANYITPITYSTTYATGATFSGLPNGVTGSWSNNAITISGSPLETGIVTYNYSIQLTGGCEKTISPGAIKVYLPPSFILNPSTAAQSLCNGTAALNVEVDPGGDTVKQYQWYRSATPVNSGGTSVRLNTTSATTNVLSTLSAGTFYYYVVVTTIGGATAKSDVSGAITVFDVPSILSGPSTGTQSICITGGSFNDLSLYANAGSGDIVKFKWYSNTNSSNTGGTIVSTIVNNIVPSIYTPSTTELGTKYYYCEVINSNGCISKSPVTGAITVSPDSVSGTAGASSLFLGSGATANLSLSGSTGNIQWQQSADGSTGWASTSGGTGSNTANYSKAITTTTYYRALVTSGNCTAVTSNVIKITITSTPITSTGIVAPVCFSSSSQTTTLPYTAASGPPNSYTIDWDATANTAGLLDQAATSYIFVTTGGTATGIVIPANLPIGNYSGIMTVTDGIGNATQPISVSVGSVSGTISGSTTVTAGTNSTVLTLSGYAGSIQWQSSNNNSSYTNILNATSATYTAVNLTSTTFYKVVVTNGSCASVTSAGASISVLSDSTAFGVTGTIDPNTINNNVATIVDDALLVTSNGMITGFTVTITSDYTDGDILAYTGALPSGIIVAPFNTTSRSLTFSGTASASIWQTLLRTVTLKSTSTCFPTNRKVSFLPSAKFFNYFNGHYYEYVSTGLTWTAAKAEAEAKNYYGLQGYLVTISSEAENSYINTLIAANSWIGASDNYSQINAAVGYSKYGSASASEGKWHWVTGPEKGIQIRTGNANTASQSGSPVAGVYQNWNATTNFSNNEPNDVWGSSPGEEDYGHMYTGSGKWNDFPNRSQTSIVEYGGMAGDNVTSNISFTRDIIILGSPIGSVTGASTVCSGTNSTTLTYNGSGTIQRWEYSVDNFSTPGIIDTNSSSNTISVDNLTISRYYRAVITTSGCSNISSSTALINVASTSSGTITSANSSICTGGNATLTLNGNSGNILKWQLSTVSDFSSNVADINVTDNTIIQPVGSVTGTFHFRAVVLNSNCSAGSTVYSDSYPVTVITGTAPVGGSVNNVSHCGGSNSGTLTLTGSTGTSYQWQVSTDGYGLVWNDVASTTTSFSYSGITSTRKYRVKVTNGSCGFVYSSIGTVTINQEFASGFISGSATVCSGNNNNSLTLNDYLGTVQWQSSSDNITYAAIANATTAIYTPINLTSTTYYRAIVTNGSCTGMPSIIGTITVKQSPIPTFTVQPGATACRNSDVTYTTQSGQSNYTWSIPGIVSTDYTITSGGTSTDNSVTLKWLTTGTKTVTINYTNSNSCAAPSATSSTTTTVSPTSVAGTVSGAASVCIGGTITLTLSGNVGSVTKWQSSTSSDFSSAVTDIANTTTSLIISSMPATTYYRAVVASGPCSQEITNGLLVTLTPNNAATLSSAAGTNSQTINITNSIANISYTILSATGATFTGLPTGVSGSFNANVVTISGTPTVSGVFNYTVSLTGGCGVASASGSINILNDPNLGNFNSFTKLFYDRSYSLIQPTSNSTGTFTYTSSTTAVATISGTTVTFVSPGTTTITATQATDGVYQSAFISATLTVSPVPILTKNGRISTTNLNYVNRTGGLSRKKGLNRKGEIVIASSSAEINTISVTNLASTSATVSTIVVTNGGSSITARGFCWNTSTNPTIENSKTSETGTLGNLTSNISGLSSGTTYYVRAYTTNSSGTTYGNEVSFDTPVVFVASTTIGTQIWMTNNLDVTTYRDGTVIPQVTDPTAWANLTTGAWCYYANTSSNGTTFGKLYNWYAVNDSRGLAPSGWHVPSDAEWTTLTTFLGGTSIAGGNIKESGTTHWSSPNTGADNSSGFTGLPGGFRNSDGTFYNIYGDGNYWSSTLDTTTNAWTRFTNYVSSSVFRYSHSKLLGFSVRCVKD
jgi:uncharacterized protein (TIGR02145 family)